MTKTSDEKSSKLKPYQMILLSCLLAAFMIINSNNVNYNRDLAKLNKEKGELFDRIINTRRLSGSSSQTYSAEICARGSDDLKEYYQKGDPKIIDIDPHKSIECEEKDETYMKALINIVRTIADDTEEDSDADTHSGSAPAPDDGSGDGTGGDGTGGHRRNLRNLGGVSDIDQQDLTDYAMRFLPMAVFLVFGILSIFGWIFCCICCCCDCCCCCCLKKTSCKVPCFIFTYVFYGLVVAISIYGLVQSNKIFVGLADTECSVLKFFEQVLHGEMKQDLPRWAGIEEIKTILSGISGSISSLGHDTYASLHGEYGTLYTLRTNFIDQMHTIHEKFINDDGTFKEPYIKTYSQPNDILSGKYVYDIVYNFGKYENNEYTPNSFLYLWDREFSTIDNEAYGYIQTADGDFQDILDQNLGPIQTKLSDGQNKLDDLTGPFTDANDEIGKIFSNSSESIDKYGKMSVKILFGGLMAMNVSLAALMLLICMFSGKSCTSCCCCRCLFKFCTHILWNILALLMILTFIIGSIIAFVGRLGGDTMGLISYIISIDNFNSSNSLIIHRLNKASDYIYTCIHGNGNIAEQLGLGNSLNSFTSINNLENNIINARDSFTNIINTLGTYNLIKDLLEMQESYTQTISMYPKEYLEPNNEKIIITYNYTLDKINNILKNKNQKDKWSNYSVTSPSTCVNDPQGSFYHPSKCKPYLNNDYYQQSGYEEYDKYAKIISDLDGFVNYAKEMSNNGDPTKADSVAFVLDFLYDKYHNYLTEYIRILNLFLGSIQSITQIISPFIGNGEAFSFLNGKFIGINLRIILKYFKHSLGGDFFTVGICLCVVGLSLILSISSTIILIVIINIGLKEAIEQNKMLNNPGIAVSQFEGVPNMPKPPY